ncbi:BfmA/BtgA family mobilization protein [Mucilaginibacter aquaedulcis]|uniref:BfmA/BtgA family mobilization protein n=1 Tax=Mucilaginibacter aquaedulcis TaxID=1187081 RepID=UPI0025B3A9D7|nr:BfmA/BtgA family mobilization protein [Mucilaginibacter aquaedulcis]MDN3551016.1 BfmA/BtgA family mobilization protein [Mucilaginibacter aquaedulcis]
MPTNEMKRWKIAMEDINVRSVRYPIVVDQKFEKIALKLGRTKRQVFIQMVDYFYKSKKDPMDLNDELLKNALMKNHQQYIGFIKAQETMLLIPLKTEMDRVSQSQGKIIDRFNSEVLKHNVDVLNNLQNHAKAFGEVARVMDAILKVMKSKETLKEQFLFILDGYIRSREAFGMMTSGREKDELIAITKEQIRLL